MIVVDTNGVGYLVIPGDWSDVARRARARDRDWAAPRLWQSELRNVLAHEIRLGRLALDQAIALMSDARALFAIDQYDIDSGDVLRLAAGSGCTACDCEFVALARALGVPLVTADRQVLAAFPGTTVSLDDFAAA